MISKMLLLLSFLGLWHFVISVTSAEKRLSIFKPQDEKIVKPTYRLYTQNNPKFPDVLDYKTPISISNSNFEGNLLTKFIIHGYLDNPLISNHWATKMKDELLKTGPMNIIIVRWTDGATSLNYFQSAKDIRTVASVTVKLILQLMELKQGSVSKIHIIGHSLGAQTAGFIGNALGGGLARITGLDPAGPGFEKAKIIDRLDPTDAKFVDVIHSNGKSLLKAGFGFEKPCGHIDFYPDGGQVMPGCKPNIPQILLNVAGGNMVEVIGGVACSHMRAIYLFTESINSDCKFCSYACNAFSEYQKGRCKTCSDNKCSRLGYYADQSAARGSHYLTTNAIAPYCDSLTCNVVI